MSAPRVAIVSDPLVQRGGGERCVEAMAESFPDAPVFALLYSAEHGPASLAPRIVPSALNRIPGATRRHRWLLPLYPAAIESFDLVEYDIIVSSHHTAAKGLLRNANQYHLCYCHTPMRALWERPFEELRTLPTPARPIAAALLRQLRTWDYVSAARVDEFLVNSETTRARVAKHYGRESTVLHPPIDVDRFAPSDDDGGNGAGDYYLVASRLVPYKRVDLAVSATAALGRQLIVVGAGPGIADLRAPHVTYKGHVSDAELVTLMQRARAMIFPAFEDFGMAPVEMMACGRPVVAFGRGGACETVVDGVTGILAPDQTVDAFVEAILRLERTHFVSARIRAHAEGFSRGRYIAALRRFAFEGYARMAEPPEPAIAR